MTDEDREIFDYISNAATRLSSILSMYGASVTTKKEAYLHAQLVQIMQELEAAETVLKNKRF